MTTRPARATTTDGRPLRTRLATLGVVGAVLVLAACGDDVADPTGTASTEPESLTSVGTGVGGWSEEPDPIGDVPVDEITALIRTQDEYDAWLDGLPSPEIETETLTADVDFDTSVVLTYAQPICDESLRVVTDGTGAIAGHAVAPTEPDEQFECEMNWLRIIVREITLDELGVDSADDVRYDPSILEDS
ncbi:hypothetical protein ACPYO6_06610 [Georgenia sp. Z1344]|uniref:hypothetical protein n=1 Tax=Georgenia sp. Z1344 TaxID=3416706 RepID=UPI003CF9AC91